MRTKRTNYFNLSRSLAAEQSVARASTASACDGDRQTVNSPVFHGTALEIRESYRFTHKILYVQQPTQAHTERNRDRSAQHPQQ